VLFLVLLPLLLPLLQQVLEFLILVSNYRMAYYTDTKTDNELFIEFTNIEGVIKYGKLD